MTATSTSGVELTYKRESTFGVAPTSTTYTPLRITSDELVPGLQHVESKVIRPDGQIDQVIRSDAEGNGSIGGELQYGEWDEFFLAGLLSEDWTGTPVTSGSVAMSSTTAASGIPFSITRGTGSFVTDGFTAGMWVKTNGWTSNTINSVFKIVGVNALTLYLQGQLQGVPVTEGSASKTVTQLAEITNGKTINTYTIQREHTEDTDEFHLFTGAASNGFTIEIPTQGPINVTHNFLSKVPTSQATRVSGTSTGSSLTSETMTAGGEVAGFMEGDPEITVVSGSGVAWDTEIFTLLQATINVTPNIRSRKAVGTIGPAIAPGRGDIGVTGSIRLYYNATSGVDDKVLFDKYLNDTLTGLAFVMKDSSNNCYVFDMPRVKYTNGSRPTPGKNEDVIITLEFQAYRNAEDVNTPNAANGVTGVTMRIARGVWPVQS